MNTKIAASALCFFALVALLAVSSPAKASSCDTYPQASWWGALSHAKVIDYVQMRHDGDWDAYLKKWDRRLETAAHTLDRGATLAFKSSGVKLKGDALGFYVSQVQKRLAVSHCLAEEARRQPQRVTASVLQ